MDSILIYDHQNSRKEIFESIRFSYDRPFTIEYVASESELKKVMLERPNSLLYIIVEQFSSLHRIIIRNIQKALPKIFICLCGSADYAMDAWKLNVFHFLEIPVVSSDLIFAYQKYIVAHHQVTDKPQEFRFKLKDGIVTIPYSSICFIKASGNYSTIHTVDDKSYLQTKQLQTYLHLCDENSEFTKVHRSLILNTNRVNKLGNQKISFFQSNYELPVSKSLEIKVKRLILGK